MTNDNNCNNKRGQMRQIFKLHDETGDGKIEIRFLGDCLRRVGGNPSEKVICEEMAKLAPKEGINFDEFMAIYDYVIRTSTNPTAEECIESFRFLDEEGSGFLRIEQIRELLTQTGEQLSQEETEEILTPWETDDGYINYEQLINLLIND